MQWRKLGNDIFDELNIIAATHVFVWVYWMRKVEGNLANERKRKAEAKASAYWWTVTDSNR